MEHRTVCVIRVQYMARWQGVGIPKHLLRRVRYGLWKRRDDLQSTFPFIPCISSPSTGTGTPHCRSLVTGVGNKPAFRRSSTISPSLLITALGDHLPPFHERLIHSSVRAWNSFNLKYIWADFLVVTLWVLSTRQRGLMSSTASKVRLHPSHWSPRASSYSQWGQTPSTKRSARNLEIVKAWRQLAIRIEIL